MGPFQQVHRGTLSCCNERFGRLYDRQTRRTLYIVLFEFAESGKTLHVNKALRTCLLCCSYVSLIRGPFSGLQYASLGTWALNLSKCKMHGYYSLVKISCTHYALCARVILGQLTAKTTPQSWGLRYDQLICVHTPPPNANPIVVSRELLRAYILCTCVHHKRHAMVRQVLLICNCQVGSRVRRT